MIKTTNMPVKKTEQFTPFENQIASIGRALSHPARIKIIELTRENGYSRNVDLIKQLKLSKSSVHNHIQKLIDADLIRLKYYPNQYLIQLTKNGLFALNNFVQEYS
jgi:Mn-dependent DtxR family transcriptional regulator